MLRAIFERLFGNSLKRVYVVIGEQINHFDEPSYSTHPNSYKFPFDPNKTLPESPESLPPNHFDLPMGLERVEGPIVIKVFKRPEHAISFAYCCNLVSASTSTFDLVEGKWCVSTDQSAFDIDW